MCLIIASAAILCGYMRRWTDNVVSVVLDGWVIVIEFQWLTIILKFITSRLMFYYYFLEIFQLLSHSLHVKDHMFATVCYLLYLLLFNYFV